MSHSIKAIGMTGYNFVDQSPSFYKLLYTIIKTASLRDVISLTYNSKYCRTIDVCKRHKLYFRYMFVHIIMYASKRREIVK